MSLGYVVHVLLDTDGPETDEATQEFDTWAEAIAAADELPAQLDRWRVISLYRAEDFPRIMQGAERR